ncbi:MAG: ABC transporter ATP-binding protein, partial [Erysipelotrichaceae bacterium]|nr:ABC transporter ATP-binding protein [Erysipelotrichaceae bacterium]
MTIIASFCSAGSEIIISWLIKEIVDLISGISAFTFSKLLAITAFGIGLMILAAVIDSVFLSRFRAKAMKQYREYVFNRLLEKGIQAFSA